MKTHLLQQLGLHHCAQQAAVCFAAEGQGYECFGSSQIRKLQQAAEAQRELLLLLLRIAAQVL